VAADLTIRPELPGDYAAVDCVVRAAFSRHPDEVALLVERIRASAHYVPDLAVIAEDDSGVTGHVMLSFVQIEGGSRPELLVLTPMSVRPDRQRIGVGSSLIRDVLGRAEAAGEPAVLVEGIPAYYPRFGFERASALGFAPAHASIPDDAFMVKRLAGFTAGLAGNVRYPPAFDHLAY
jgi:putative acetyltransferase